MEATCLRCYSKQLVIDGGERVCSECGLVAGKTYDHEFAVGEHRSDVHDSNGYKRIFYFNERCTRWACTEPKISPDIWELIEKEADANPDNKYGDLRTNCSRSTICSILRSVIITPEMQMKHRSNKFRKQPLTQKRFYDKYAEKWKTIRWQITGVSPLLPDHRLVEKVKDLFQACQIPFSKFRHHPRCDGRAKCQKYFKCQHNFLNYDFMFRMFFQICDSKYGFDNSYETFKHEFPLVSDKVVKGKLRPMFEQICKYNDWPVPPYD